MKVVILFVLCFVSVFANAAATGASSFGPVGKASVGLPNDGSAIRSGDKNAIGRLTDGTCIKRYFKEFGERVACPKKP
jgi:hypothetical protein